MNPTKSELRSRIRSTRSARGAEARSHDQELITLELLKLVIGLGARRIAAFLPSESEPPIAEFLELAHYQGVVIVVPRAHDDGSMTWVVYHPDHDQVRSVLGIPEIAEGEGLPTAEALPRLDLVLIPAAAVDQSGYRLGWGKGFYDRALASTEFTAPVYAVVFDDEVLPEVPREAHDERVSGAVTPTKTLRFS